VAEPNAQNLKLYTEHPKVVEPQLDTLAGVPGMLTTFQATTGWSLQYVAAEDDPDNRNDLTWSAPVQPGEGDPVGYLSLEPVVASSAFDLESARAMGSAVAELFGEMMHLRHALWQREAELAAGVPLVPLEDEEKHLAERLEAVLKGGAEAVGCDAAALYMLDDATTELKLRSSWGLPFDRLIEPARRLQGEFADLEALLGHAVVLEDTAVMKRWKVPEDFPAAVCVPVSTPTMLLGTLWVFSSKKRNFTDQETNMLEVVSGRLASDLEREMLMRVGIDGAQLMKQVGVAERMQQHQLPSISPVLDGWELAGWTDQAQTLGGDFYDWFSLPDGMLAVAVCDTLEQGLPAAMAANTVKAALRSHAQYHDDAEQVLKKANLTLWTGSAGDQFAKVFCGLIDTITGRVNYASAGVLAKIVLRPDGWESLGHSFPPLGECPETDYESLDYVLQPGEALLVFTDGVRDALDGEGRPLSEAGLADPLFHLLGLSAKEMLSAARDILRHHTAGSQPDDRTILVIKRT